jgi:hypothetical protein
MGLAFLIEAHPSDCHAADTRNAQDFYGPVRPLEVVSSGAAFTPGLARGGST